MNSDDARRIYEDVARAKDALLSALRTAEQAGKPALSKQIGSLCGKVESMQAKIEAIKAKSPG